MAVGGRGLSPGANPQRSSRKHELDGLIVAQNIDNDRRTGLTFQLVLFRPGTDIRADARFRGMELSINAVN